MPTCRDIITRAFQKARIYGGGQEPTAADLEAGLDELKSLYEGWAANGMFGRLEDVLAESDIDAAQGQRIHVTNSAAITIPTEFEEAPPYDMALIEVVDATEQTVTRHFYDAGQAAWIDLNDLDGDSLAPLAARGAGGLAACLALILADEYGGQIGPSVVRQAASFKTGLSLKLGGDWPRTAPDYF